MLSRFFRSPDPPDVAQICAATHLPKRLARRILFRFDTQQYSEITQLLLAQSGDRLFHDPIEDLPHMAEALRNASADTDVALAGIERGMGFCHRLWRTKKRILKTKHGIDWLTPGEMNPTTRFD